MPHLIVHEKKKTLDDFLAQAIDDNVYVLIKVKCFDNEMSLEENWKKTTTICNYILVVKDI